MTPFSQFVKKCRITPFSHAFFLPFSHAEFRRDGKALRTKSVSGQEPDRSSSMACSIASRDSPVRFWMRPRSSSCLPSISWRSSSVSLAHFCLRFPLMMFQSPFISSLFIDLIIGLSIELRPWGETLLALPRITDACDYAEEGDFSPHSITSRIYFFQKSSKVISMKWRGLALTFHSALR